MGEIKSAFERAMEKADRLGKLSPEEMRRREEAEYIPMGRAIAERYLEHGHIRVLEEDVAKRGGDERAVVARAAASRLVEAIDLDGDGMQSRVGRALDGLRVLAIDKKDIIDRKSAKITGLVIGFDEERERTFRRESQRIERDERESLERIGISGDALGDINLEASQAWARIDADLRAQFSERLDPVKRELQDELAKP